MLSLIETLLGFARLDAGQEHIRVEHVIAADVVDEALDIVRPIAESKGVSIRVEVPHDVIALDTDPLKLRQILVNLVTNAVKYTDVGNVVLIVRVEGLGSSLKIHFEVTDTGRGIAVGDQGHVFEEFWRGAHPLRPQSDGTGLGLPVARLRRVAAGGISRSNTNVQSADAASARRRSDRRPSE